MKRLLARTLLICAGLGTVACPVSVADSNLQAAIEETLQIVDPSADDMLGLLYLECDDCGISDLDGLDYASNLVSLSLTHNQISDISPVASLTQLTELNLNNNDFSDLTPLSGLTGLIDLNIHRNPISDMSPLASLINLQILEIRLCDISDVSPLAGLTDLYELIINDNQISDISPFSGLVNLETLLIGSNEISDISVLADLHALDRLSLSLNSVSDISPLTALTNLRNVSLFANPLDASACRIHIPQIEANNPGVSVYAPRCDTMPVGYVLSIASSPGGEVIAPGEGSFDYADSVSVEVEAQTLPGYHFAGFTGTHVSQRNPLTLTMDQDHEIYAEFTLAQTILHVDDDAPNDPGPLNGFLSDPAEDGSEGHPFDSIQEAIELASDGVEILVHPGTYVETLDFLGKSVRLNGYDPNFVDLPVVDANGAGPVMRFTQGEDPNCLIRGLLLTGGLDPIAGAVLCDGSAPTFEQCLIVGNRVTDMHGAAIHGTESFPSFHQCTIADNIGGAAGAGVRMVDSQISLTNCILWNNWPRDLFVIGTESPALSYSLTGTPWPGLGTLSLDPLFARPGLWLDPGNPIPQSKPTAPDAQWLPGDYHLRSTYGRWLPQSQEWVDDSLHSPAIDAGDPNSGVALEPASHGDRLNMGVYGGTHQASQSQ